MRNGKLFELIREMSKGKRVIAVFGNMERAAHAFWRVCEMLDAVGVEYEAHKANSRMTVKYGSGSIEFMSDHAPTFRGRSCDAFYCDEDAFVPLWRGPWVVRA